MSSLDLGTLLIETLKNNASVLERTLEKSCVSHGVEPRFDIDTDHNGWDLTINLSDSIDDVIAALQENISDYVSQDRTEEDSCDISIPCTPTINFDCQLEVECCCNSGNTSLGTLSDEKTLPIEVSMTLRFNRDSQGNINFRKVDDLMFPREVEFGEIDSYEHDEEDEFYND